MILSDRKELNNPRKALHLMISMCFAALRPKVTVGELQVSCLSESVLPGPPGWGSRARPEEMHRALARTSHRGAQVQGRVGTMNTPWTSGSAAAGRCYSPPTTEVSAFPASSMVSPPSCVLGDSDMSKTPATGKKHFLVSIYLA